MFSFFPLAKTTKGLYAPPVGPGQAISMKNFNKLVYYRIKVMMTKPPRCRRNWFIDQYMSL